MCASLQKREASAAERQRSEACGIQEPHATVSVLHVSVKRMSQRGYRHPCWHPLHGGRCKLAKLLFRCTRCNCFSMMVDPLPPGMGSPALPWHHGVKWKPGASPAHLTHIIGSHPHYSFVSSGWQAWRRHSGPLSAPRGSDIRRHHCCASAHAWPLSDPWAAAPVPRMVRAAPRMEPPRLAAM